MTIKHTISKAEEELLIKMYYNNIKFEKMYEETRIPRRQITAFFKERERTVTT